MQCTFVIIHILLQFTMCFFVDWFVAERCGGQQVVLQAHYAKAVVWVGSKETLAVFDLTNPTVLTWIR